MDANGWEWKAALGGQPGHVTKKSSCDQEKAVWPAKMGVVNVKSEEKTEKKKL